MFGPGRPSAKPNILSVSPLTFEDLNSYVPDKSTNRVKAIRESHHRVAKLMAIGLRNFEIAERTGYSEVRISHFRKDPAFLDLVATYKDVEDKAFEQNRDLYFETVISNRQLAAGRLNEMLNNDEHEFTVSQLVAIHADSADRTGYPKRTIATNINVDFAARLDRAVERSMKVIEAIPAPSAPQPQLMKLAGVGEAEVQPDPRLEVLPPLIKRRA